MHSVLFGKFLALLIGDLTFVLEVALGANQEHADVWVARLLDLLHPLLYLLVTGRIHHRVGEDDSVGTLVKGLRDVSKPLLSGCVPYVQGYLLPIVLDSLDLEIHPDCRQIVSLESVVAVSKEDAGFSNSAVPNHQEL